jgi:hypothetical protein
VVEKKSSSGSVGSPLARGLSPDRAAGLAQRLGSSRRSDAASSRRSSRSRRDSTTTGFNFPLVPVKLEGETLAITPRGSKAASEAELARKDAEASM